jgi:hypothetical protein
VRLNLPDAYCYSITSIYPGILTRQYIVFFRMLVVCQVVNKYPCLWNPKIRYMKVDWQRVGYE